MLPQFSGLQAYFQEAGVSILIMVLIILVLVLLVKQEFGAMIGFVVVIGIIIIFVKKPDETLIKFAEGVINKIMGTGGQ